MKANSDKSHLLLSCNEQITTVIYSTSIESDIKEVFLGITTNRELKFDDHVNSTCKTACQRFNPVAHLALFINVNKRRISMKAIIELKFRNCLFVWMFHSQSPSN